MRLIPLMLGAALFAAPAKADKFWLSDPKAEANAPAGSSPNVIEGVLIAESDEGYHVRIVGGEILLPKASVFKIEKDGLTLNAIVDAENRAKDKGARDNEERRLAQQIAAQERTVQIAEASARREARVLEAVENSNRVAAGFDPVIGRATPMLLTDAERIAELKRLFRVTRDRSYLRQLRRLRRLR